MIPKKESLTVEFKSDTRKYPDNELVEAVIGMANTSGGVLYLGVEDNGEITGVAKIHADPIGVIALIANKTVPSVSARAEIITENGTDILKIEIPTSRAIVASKDGKILRRRLKLDGSPENIPMYPYEINSRLSELSLLDYSAQPMHEASINDLDPNERLRLRNLIRQKKGDNTLLELSDEELDKALGLTKEENGIIYPTVTGLLLIGKEDKLKEIMPTAKSSFQVLEGVQVKINNQYSKPLLATFEIFENYFNAWNPEREIEIGLFRIPIPEYSKTALREGLVNAFCHRDYTILQMVRVAIEDDGLSISSPGGFIEGVNLNNLLTVEPHGRNQNLADALKRIGLAERTGRGIDRIYEGSIIYGKPLPDYSESTSSYVKLFIAKAKPDLAFTKMIAEEENRIGKSLPINSLLILSTLQTLRRASISEIANTIHISEAKVKANIEKLIESGLIEPLGNGKSRNYILSAKIYKQQSNAIGYIRQTGIDQLRFEEMIIKLAQKQGFITRDNVVELLTLNEDQAYRLLHKLTKQNKLQLIGRGRKSKYILIS